MFSVGPDSVYSSADCFHSPSTIDASAYRRSPMKRDVVHNVPTHIRFTPVRPRTLEKCPTSTAVPQSECFYTGTTRRRFVRRQIRNRWPLFYFILPFSVFVRRYVSSAQNHVRNFHRSSGPPRKLNAISLLPDKVRTARLHRFQRCPPAPLIWLRQSGHKSTGRYLFVSNDFFF